MQNQRTTPFLNNSNSRQSILQDHLRKSKTPLPYKNKSQSNLPQFDPEYRSNQQLISPQNTIFPSIISSQYNQFPSTYVIPSFPQLNNHNQTFQPPSSSPNLDYTSEENSENIKVCVRIRPFNLKEQSRQDEKCLDIVNQSCCLFTNKNLRRNFDYDLVFGEKSSQEDLFYNCSINKLLDSAMDGYSVTVFAYGQTGSGKTYTVMGRDDIINKKVLSNDHYSGFIPKSIKYIWSAVRGRREKFYIKVSFLEIYNEQINDLLNPASINLQIRLDQKQGFFVEGLLVIECKTPEDIVEVIVQGNKNRKTGSHELNKDSSRSHSILTIYIISELENCKRYGKVSFVDLAGSERLKETKSTGGMLKETGNINRSLMILGKVISALTEKKNSVQHIPYRESKLTQLLMDSIGGSSKTLMIACVSPSLLYADESFNTLSYASRTRNIQNRPTIQMDRRDRSMLNIRNETNLYQEENDFLKKEFIKLIGMIPSMEKGGLTEEEITTFRAGGGLGKMTDENIQAMQNELGELKRLKDSNEFQIKNLRNENNLLVAKLNNLETVFIGGDILRNEDGSVKNDLRLDYNVSAIMLENKELRKTIDHLEIEKIEMKEIMTKKEIINNSMHTNESEFERLKEHNAKMCRRVEFLQKRERELLETIMKLKMDNSIRR